MDDSRIVDLFLERNEDAVSECAAKYGFRLKNLSLGIVGNDETAEECENDTYMQAWSSIPPNEPREHLFSYLACIIRRLSIDHCRREMRLKRNAELVSLSNELEECIPSADKVERCIDDKEFVAELNRFLTSLSEEKRALFIRRYFYTDSIEKLCGTFSMSASKVTSMLFRMRRSLRKSLSGEK